MTSLYDLQQDTLALFQGRETQFLNDTEINNLKIYKGLVINNMDALLAKIFKEIHAFLEPQWRDITLDYLERYPSQSAIYSQLLREFPDFVASDFFKEKYADNNYFAELAKYKWLDLKSYNSTNKEALNLLVNDKVDIVVAGYPTVKLALMESQQPLTERRKLVKTYKNKLPQKRIVVDEVCQDTYSKNDKKME